MCVVVNEALVELLSKSALFSSLRDFLHNKNNKKVYSFFSDAIECPYCTSMWTSLFLTFLVFVFTFPQLTGSVLVDFFLFLVACHRLSNLFHNFSDRYITREYLAREANEGEK